MNPRLTKKDVALIKGALRRVFARSEVRNRLIDATIIEGYHDPKRKRVKRWCRCPLCLTPTPRSYMVLDHVLPLIELGKSVYDYEIGELVDRMWCAEENLKPCCETCHSKKTSEEQKIRKSLKGKKI